MTNNHISTGPDQLVAHVAEIVASLPVERITGEFNRMAADLAAKNGWNHDRAGNELYAWIAAHHPEIAGLVAVALLTASGEL